MSKSKAIIEVYTDGSATSADKPGGWAFRVVGNGTPIFENSGHMDKASNNDAELEAAIQGLEYLKKKYEVAQRDPKLEEIYLVSDSQLVLGWASGRFRVKQTEKVERVKNLRSLMVSLGVKPKWVRGHAGNAHNIRCDKMARKARLGDTVRTTPEQKPTIIGTKQRGTMSMWYKDALKIIDLEQNIVEDYDPSIHGQRSSRMELQSEKS